MAIISPITTQVPVASTPMMGAPVPSTAPVQQHAEAPPSNVRAIPIRDVPATERSVKDAVDNVNKMLAQSGSNEVITFSYEPSLQQLYVKIVDRNSGTVVRQIPSKDFIRNQIALREMIGLILDTKA